MSCASSSIIPIFTNMMNKNKKNMLQIIEGELAITHGTGKNLFVLNSVSTVYASVIVEPNEAKSLTQADIGKKYRFCPKIVKVGISEFTYAYNLEESENVTPEELINKRSTEK